ncbi:MAG: hypothetical protein DRJ65_03840 [Acidobacteria bacterium]|nr:MAG: hypothetical protein DRJ65_03840 [Acidobacteriota bacterium]
MAELFFAEFRFDTKALRLEGPDGEVEIRAKTLELLTYLINHRNRFVPRDELMEKLWPEVTVTASSLTQCISELRQALGDSVNEPRYVETRIKKGYRFAATVYFRPTEHLEPLPPPPEVLKERGSSSRRNRSLIATLLFVITMAAAASWWALRQTEIRPTPVVVLLVASLDSEEEPRSFGERVREAVVDDLSSVDGLILPPESMRPAFDQGLEVEINCCSQGHDFELSAILRERRTGETLWGWTWVVPKDGKTVSSTTAEIAARVRLAIVRHTQAT